MCFPVCLFSHARLRCMCTCNRCTFCLCQNLLNSELLQMVRAKLYTVVLRRSLLLFCKKLLLLVSCDHHSDFVPFIPYFFNVFSSGFSLFNISCDLDPSWLNPSAVFLSHYVCRFIYSGCLNVIFTCCVVAIITLFPASCLLFLSKLILRFLHSFFFTFSFHFTSSFYTVFAGVGTLLFRVKK